MYMYELESTEWISASANSDQLRNLLCQFSNKSSVYVYTVKVYDQN